MYCLICYLAGLISLLSFFIYLFKGFSMGKPKILRYESEKYYIDPISKEKKLFPNLIEDNQKCDESVYLSVIVPAYNEEQRLPKMLDEALEYLESRYQIDQDKEVFDQNEREKSRPSRGIKNMISGPLITLSSDRFSYEVIIVDDGSSDKTSEIGLKYSKKYGTDKVRVLKLEKNRGKGGAVRLGVLSSRGKIILFADADGATKFSDYTKLERTIVNTSPPDHHFIIIGSRAHLEKEAIANRSLFRTILMKGFHFIVWLLTVRTVRDTQCGFKAFSRDCGLLLFKYLHSERWAFDVEILLLAESINVPIIEVAVKWTEIEGSKLIPVLSWLQMGKDVLTIFLMYFVNFWSYPKISNDK